MGKKIKEKEVENNKFKIELNLNSTVKRGIATILLILLAILFSFGFFGIGGSFGVLLDKASGTVFGWGKWLFPVILVLASIILLYKKKAVFYTVKIIGLTIAFFCLLGFFHIFFPLDSLLEIAKNGEGGGYVGYFISISLISLTGKIAAVLVLLSFLVIGTMIAFNFSIVEFFLELIRKKKDALQKGNVKESIDGKEDIMIEKISEKDIDESNLKDNIREIKFVSGPTEAEAKDLEKEQTEVNDDFNIKEISFSKKPKDNNLYSKKNKNKQVEWRLPTVSLLDDFKDEVLSGNVDENTDIIKETFSNFGIKLEDGGHKTGPSVTQYSFRPAVGVKLSKIVALGDDLALALAEHPIRIEAPIPGKSLIGIEVPNKKPAKVSLREALSSDEFKNKKSPLTLILGKNVEGTFVLADLGKMPHLLIAGATGTGKSVCINSIILSLLFQNSPDDLKLILVDPKRVELSLYNKIPHLLADVITDNKKVVNALKWAVREMEERYKILEKVGSRDLESYSKKLEEGLTINVIDPDTSEAKKEKLKKLPFIVIVIDELADLMASNGKEVEGAIMRLAQMARAVGIHLIISTQRPSVEVLTGIIKANIGNRIALQVVSQIDSRTIIDMRGAEKLLGKGDLLFLSSESPKPRRLQNSFVSEDEVKQVVDFIKEQADQFYKEEDEDNELDEELENELNNKGESSGLDQVDFSITAKTEDEDNLYPEVKEFILEAKKASASLLQRRFRIGYNRAARLIDSLESDGIVGSQDGAKPREILVGSNIQDISNDKGDDNEEDISQEQRDKWQV